MHTYARLLKMPHIAHMPTYHDAAHCLPIIACNANLHKCSINAPAEKGHDKVEKHDDKKQHKKDHEKDHDKVQKHDDKKDHDKKEDKGACLGIVLALC